MKDYYLSDIACYNRLLKEYEKYKTLIVAVDFDGTINDFHNEGLTFEGITNLLKECNKLGLRLVIYSANTDEKFILKKCSELGIEIEGVNVQLLDEFKYSKKLYYNILLDDRAGLSSAFNVLSRLVKEVSKNDKSK